MIVKVNKIPLPQNTASKEVVFPSAIQNPDSSFLSVTIVDVLGKLVTNIDYTVDSITSESFTVTLTPAIPSAGYFLSYVYSDQVKQCDEDFSTPAIEYNTDIGYVTEGDSWVGIPVLQLKLSGDPPNEDVVNISMTFHASNFGPALLTLSEVDGITIEDANNWEFSIPPIIDFPLTAGTYYFKIKTIDTTGFKRTWISGRLFVTKFPVAEIV